MRKQIPKSKKSTGKIPAIITESLMTAINHPQTTAERILFPKRRKKKPNNAIETRAKAGRRRERKIKHRNQSTERKASIKIKKTA